ncbi:MAG: dTDP-4-dehydrorhamnose 3,5-epimerase [Lentisphaeria bacterium]|nr:dTDP-4-dehydrorhamnose 3,5-epimerase [Lentisphaeria bacterium]
MQILPTAIPDIRILVPEVFGDPRGYFMESWNEEKYKQAGIRCSWVQDNESRSSYGVLRGLHYQAGPYAQAKLVRVICGKVLDVAVDLRKGSPTFGKYVSVELSGENKYQLFIPRGFAHGFAVLSESAVFAYKCDNIYMPEYERGIAFDDAELGIDWRLAPEQIRLSARDQHHPVFAEAELFEYQIRKES